MSQLASQRCAVLCNQQCRSSDGVGYARRHCLVAACRQALEGGDTAKLAELMNSNFDLRRRMFGDAALGSVNLQMIDLARSGGGESTP